MRSFVTKMRALVPLFNNIALSISAKKRKVVFSDAMTTNTRPMCPRSKVLIRSYPYDAALTDVFPILDRIQTVGILYKRYSQKPKLR
jgi:hypothetical protein